MSAPSRSCRVCGGFYPQGDYRAHRALPEHIAVLRDPWARETTESMLRWGHMQRLLEEGKNYGEIGKAVGISRQRVSQLFIERGIRQHRQRLFRCFVCGMSYKDWDGHYISDEHAEAVEHLVSSLERLGRRGT